MSARGRLAKLLGLLLACCCLGGAVPAGAKKGGGREHETSESELPKEPESKEVEHKEQQTLDEALGAETHTLFLEAIKRQEEEESGRPPKLREKLVGSDGGDRLVARPPRPPLDPAQQRACHEIAKYVARSSSVDLASLLTDPLIGAHPWASDPHWAAESLDAKLTMLVDSAARRSHTDGQKLLAILARRLAQGYETVKYDKVLAQYWRIVPAPPPVGFHTTPRPIKTIRLSPSLQQAVAAIAKYITDGGHVTMADLIEDAGLSSEAARRIHSEPAVDVEERIEDVLREAGATGKLASDRTRAVLERIAQHIARYYETARYSPKLKPYLSTRDPHAEARRAAHDLANSMRQLDAR